MTITDKIAQLREEIQIYLPMLRKASDTILSEGVSKYPIFVLHKEAIDLGIQIADRTRVKGGWNVYVSTYEEFVSKNLIKENRQRAFLNKYQSPEETLCLFVLSELGAQFIFIPKIGEI